MPRGAHRLSEKCQRRELPVSITAHTKLDGPDASPGASVKNSLEWLVLPSRGEEQLVALGKEEEVVLEVWGSLSQYICLKYSCAPRKKVTAYLDAHSLSIEGVVGVSHGVMGVVYGR